MHSANANIDPAVAVARMRQPGHVAIVMDGNGRWAQQRRRPRTFGHHAGQKAVRGAIEFCLRHGVQALTLFAFSSENWQRPPAEVSALMELFLKALDREVDELHGHGVQIRFIGDLSAFAPGLSERMQRAMQKTRENAKLHLNIAVNYGGRWDIAQATRQIAQRVAAGDLRLEDISEATISAAMSLADLAPIDLFIRTGGEHRISNFLLWQIAYAELYFTETLWPDFGEEAFASAFADYAGRERRFGKTSAQVTRSA